MFFFPNVFIFFACIKKKIDLILVYHHFASSENAITNSFWLQLLKVIPNLGIRQVYTREKIPRRRAWQPTLVFLPGESHGQRSLVGYRPWGHKELDMTKHITARIGANVFWAYPDLAEGLSTLLVLRLEFLSNVICFLLIFWLAHSRSVCLGTRIRPMLFTGVFSMI